ncbi:late secretory pathway protein AVL9 homolog isoform X6 [Homo sapiens]|uniref:late secretory pathway protein AVL9 homolog isoform X6 n=1 Tax=Homo sapiens TaxID=9606 RepID=UPI001FB0E829|nr:late secretory pathway protein AVL9 homolog isoform X6 [Homo sapiens]XP_054213640.1 late secretory pathway protein AVL9 homolog isoform X6 [Homo sapiens]
MEKARRGGDGVPRGPVLHIVVVGFHHKKGCQVEFSYPPLIPGDGHDSHTLPEEWKYLPFLALPDGAHNYQEDTVFFHLPPRNGNGATVFGISCYRQIEAKALKVRQADITRETVQKSVCVLSKLPLYGLLQAKLQLITHAYFEEKDFSQISILKELYEHMNSSLGGASLEGSQVYLGLSPRDLVLHFRHKVLILFKLILLEKKVLFYISPVNKLVGALMTVLSLFPDSSESDWETLDPSVLEDPNLKEREQLGSDQTNLFPKDSVPSESLPITVQPQANTGQVVLIPGLISGLEEDQYGMPLAIFTKGYLCLPYMALQQHHLLSDVTVRGFVAGATNILFRQQKHLSDAIVEVEEALIQIHDPELRKLLNPTTADLRFADYLVRHVTENRDDVFLDGTGWEGGDEWIRAQFAVYIHALLAATLQLVLFRIVNVAKKLETSWSQLAGMLYKQEKLLASQLEELFPVQRQLCLHGFPLSPLPPPKVSLSHQMRSLEQGVRGCYCFLRFKCPLSVCCSQAVTSHRSTAGDHMSNCLHGCCSK